MVTSKAPIATALEAEMMRSLRSRQRLRLPHRDSIVAWSGAGLFLVAATALAARAGSVPSLWVAVVLIGSYALVSRVPFELVTGHALPTELVLVPMLFVLPPAIVPLCVAAGLILGRAPEFVRGRVRPDRIPLFLASSAHALGPAVVLAVAGPSPPSLRHWPIYILALAAQFAVDYATTVPWARFFYGVKPLAHLRQMQWLWIVDVCLAPIGLAVAVLSLHRPAAVLLVVPLVGLLAIFARERQVRIDHALDLSKAYRGTAMLLGDVIEADNEYTGQHSRDVVDLVLHVADELKLDPSTRRDAEFTALLHDVGKIRMPRDIINKPGPLTDAEFEVIKTHTIEGEQMLKQIGGLLSDVATTVRSCHERWDGTGYPDHLTGDNIPLPARIVACCDAYSAMTTNRPYRAAMSRNAATQEILRCRGTHFDPTIADALMASLARRTSLSEQEAADRAESIAVAA